MVRATHLHLVNFHEAAFDINYAPANNHKHWFRWKQRALGKLVADRENRDEFFEKYISAICFDKSLPEPSSQREQDDLWKQVVRTQAILMPCQLVWLLGRLLCF